jgi:hypothetical protein
MRVTAAQRRKAASVAEAEILRFAGNHALWHKHVHNVTLDPAQVLKFVEMDEHPNTIDTSCRRTGKTAGKEWYALHHLATRPFETEGIVAPRQQQAENNLAYHLEAIKRSPMLQAFIAVERGRQKLNDSGYRFANGSGADCYGIMAQIDGDAITFASLEETDDMPQDRLTSRFLPMLGAKRRPGTDLVLAPQIRITGVWKGADVLESLIKSGSYHVLPAVDVYMGIELGALDEKWAEDMRAQLTHEEWIRQFLCQNTAATNFIWEKWIKRASAIGLQAGIEIAEPVPGGRFRKAGLVGFGYDHLGHGEDPAASHSALWVTQQLGNWFTLVWARRWAPNTDEKVIHDDLVSAWDYFRPDYALGDAYGVGMLSAVNHSLYAKGLTDIDIRTVGDGTSSQSTWPEWAFVPVRFDGMTKHQMATTLKSAFHNGLVAMPYVDENCVAAQQPGTTEYELLQLARQLRNVRADATRAAYASYTRADKKVNDDAGMASVWALVSRGMADVPAVISQRTRSRESLLGLTPAGVVAPAHALGMAG